ncbi:hypothetical protein [Mucilaginibacter segetis]|uniref:Uncharacterized protein n=1 Tax=Mucilaginibacter segetis TaxID=2793071 RepID=A0A934PTT0_9SPHI|nr:hypothetical protein [Mucilaginibacter segetis]MBK0379275.1 hypothetical protein [Mucilaginibacter segetis]
MGHAQLETDELFVKKGTMTRNPFHMDRAEFAAWKAQAEVTLKERLFAIGQPLVYEKDGKFVAEYPDGHIEGE